VGLMTQIDMGDSEYQHLQESHKTSDHYSREIALRVTFLFVYSVPIMHPPTSM
jgi:hypothetical protein